MPESPELLIKSYLGNLATKSDEILHGDPILGALGFLAKTGDVQFRIRLEYDTESPESLISGDLVIAAT